MSIVEKGELFLKNVESYLHFKRTLSLIIRM
jgi:hypothetical protein